MSHLLISLNPVLQKLQNEGFDIEVRGQYLWVHRVPYINASIDIASGTLVMALNISGDKILAPSDHTALWIGEKPRFQDGASYHHLSIVNGRTTLEMASSATISSHVCQTIMEDVIWITMKR